MQSINAAQMINTSGQTVTVSGINIIGPGNTSMQTMGHPVTVATSVAAPGQTGHQLAQPNIQLIIATKSLPQAVPVTTQVTATGTPVAVKQHDVISIPVSATPMTVKPEIITLPMVSHVNAAQGCHMLVAQPSTQINQINQNQIITTSTTALPTNVIATNNGSTVTVTGQTPGLDLLACLECGKHFVSVAKLKSHEKTHSKSRPFKCIDCNKSFTVRYSLICHTRTHTRERPYQCSQCGSRFTQASSLKTHQIYKHTKNFPYACKQCDRGFISPGQRHEHVVRTHLKIATTTSGGRTKSKSSKSRSKQQHQQNQQHQNQQHHQQDEDDQHQHQHHQQDQEQENVNTIEVNCVTSVADSTVTTSPITTVTMHDAITSNTVTIPVNSSIGGLGLGGSGGGNQITLSGGPLEGQTVTLVNATILQPADGTTQVGLDSDQLPPGSTITLAIQAIQPDSDDSLGPSMSSAACQTALSLPPLL